MEVAVSLKLWAMVKGGLLNVQRCFEQREKEKMGVKKGRRGCGQRSFNGKKRQRENCINL